MAIAKGTCVSFYNQPKAHFGLLWVRAPGTIAVNDTWMKTEDSMLVKRIAAYTNLQGAAKKTYHDKKLIFSQTDRKFKTKFSTLIPDIIYMPIFR